MVPAVSCAEAQVQRRKSMTNDNGGSMPTTWRNKWPRQERVQRKERHRVLRGRGIKPAKKQWVICVETTAIEIPGWARAKAEPRLSQSPHRVWFRGRNSGRAKILERQDRQAGGRPELTAVEWRMCPVCDRMLLGLEAEARRKLDESGVLGRTLPCSSTCKSRDAEGAK
jgi:hypothetical protein